MISACRAAQGQAEINFLLDDTVVSLQATLQKCSNVIIQSCVHGSKLQQQRESA